MTQDPAAAHSKTKRSRNNLAIDWWSIDRVKPYPRNARVVSSKAVEKVAASIKEFGWRQPIVVDRGGVIVAGHTRLLAARHLGLTRVPVHVASELTKAQLRAYRLADNRTNEETSWNSEFLGLELAQLKVEEFNLALTGFELREVAPLLEAGKPGLTDEDAAPAVEERAVSALGDLWLLGDHRVLCGDSTDLAAVSRLCGPAKANMVFTDPPYGVSFGRANHNPRAKRWPAIVNDDLILGEQMQTFLKACFANLVLVCEKASPVYVWSATMSAGYDMLAALKASGIHVQSQIIWVKNCIVLGQADYQWRHEPCWYGWTEGTNHYWAGGRSLSSVWEYSKDANQDYEHPAQKPVLLAQAAIHNSCPPAGIVLDLFGGSGSTLIGCEKTGRAARLMELMPNYVDVIVKRWQDFTGKQATLEATGATFEAVSRTRVKAA